MHEDEIRLSNSIKYKPLSILDLQAIGSADDLPIWV